MRVAAGDELIVEPGVQIQFAGPYAFRILGDFSAQGNAVDSVWFTSTSGNPQWGGIKLDSLSVGSDTARFEHCSISNMLNTSINIINTSKVRFSHSRIADNTGLYIGSVYVALGDPVFDHVTFANNSSGSGSEWDASPSVTNCSFYNNSSPWSAGSISLYRSDITPEPQFINCHFEGNNTGGSGGVFVSHSNCVPCFENCTFLNNFTSTNGGVGWDGYTQGGAVYAYNEAQVTRDHCEFVGNHTNSQGGALYLNDYSTCSINRCLFANNEANLGGVRAAYDGSAANWHFAAGQSPCENTGTPDTSELGLGDLDFEGDLREQGIIDIGPYEGGEFVLPYNPLIDLNNDEVINMNDLLSFLSGFGCSGQDCVGDLNGDLVVNTVDLLVFITLFGGG